MTNLNDEIKNVDEEKLNTVGAGSGDCDCGDCDCEETSQSSKTTKVYDVGDCKNA